MSGDVLQWAAEDPNAREGEIGERDLPRRQRAAGEGNAVCVEFRRGAAEEASSRLVGASKMITLGSASPIPCQDSVSERFLHLLLFFARRKRTILPLIFFGG